MIGRMRPVGKHCRRPWRHLGVRTFHLLSGTLGADGVTLTVVFNRAATNTGTGFFVDDAVQGPTSLTLMSGDGTAIWVFQFNDIVALAGESLTITHQLTSPQFQDPIFDACGMELGPVIKMFVRNNSTQT